MADGISAKVEGVGAVGSAIEEQLQNIAARAKVAMVAEAAAIAADAVERCPKQSGALAASVSVKMTPDGAQVGFGNAQVTYALEVHERIDVEHANGEAKFLEHAKDAASTQLVQRVAERAKVGG